MFAALKVFWGGSIPGITSAEELREEGVIIQFGRPPNRIDLLNRIWLVSWNVHRPGATIDSNSIGSTPAGNQGLPSRNTPMAPPDLHGSLTVAPLIANQRCYGEAPGRIPAGSGVAPGAGAATGRSKAEGRGTGSRACPPENHPKSLCSRVLQNSPSTNVSGRAASPVRPCAPNLAKPYFAHDKRSRTRHAARPAVQAVFVASD